MWYLRRWSIRRNAMHILPSLLSDAMMWRRWRSFEVVWGRLVGRYSRLSTSNSCYEIAGGWCLVLDVCVSRFDHSLTGTYQTPRHGNRHMLCYFSKFLSGFTTYLNFEWIVSNQTIWTRMASTSYLFRNRLLYCLYIDYHTPHIPPLLITNTGTQVVSSILHIHNIITMIGSQLNIHYSLLYLIKSFQSRALHHQWPPPTHTPLSPLVHPR